MGIKELRTRKAMTGAYVLEIPGGSREEREAKADALAGKLEAVFSGKDDVKIARSLRMAQVRVRDLDESIEQEDIIQALVKVGGGDPQKIRVGRRSTTPYGMGAVIVQCPLATANKVVAGSRLMVGWAACKVNMLKDRPLQCFKCLGLGHVQQRCPSAMDRGKCCYRCGVEGHLAADCQASPKCMVCTQAGRSARHRTSARCGVKPTRDVSDGVGTGKGKRKKPPAGRYPSGQYGWGGCDTGSYRNGSPPTENFKTPGKGEVNRMEVDSPPSPKPQRQLRSRREILKEPDTGAPIKGNEEPQEESLINLA